jgi:predicted dehydrogenase
MVIRVGVIGSGVGNRLHIPALRQLQDVIVQKMQLSHLSPEAPSPRLAQTGYLPLDLVVIATPPHVHLPCLRAAVDLAELMLCEKPAGIDDMALRQFLADESNPGAVVNYQLRFHPIIRKLRGLIGPETLQVHIRYKSDAGLHPAPDWYRYESMGGGPLIAVGSHLIDLTHFFGLRYSRLRATRREPTDGALMIDGVCQNGLHITVSIDVKAPKAEFTATVVTKSATLVGDVLGNEISYIAKSHPLKDCKSGQRTLTSSATDGPWRRGQDRLYRSLITSGHPSGSMVVVEDNMATLTDALMVHEVMATARQSMLTKGAELAVIYAPLASSA